MTAATKDAPAMRTARVTYYPPLSSTKVVRFQGDTFGELQQRLIAAKVPGISSKSYIELLIPNEGFVCPLADESLPDATEITISVHGEACAFSWPILPRSCYLATPSGPE